MGCMGSSPGGRAAFRRRRCHRKSLPAPRPGPTVFDCLGPTTLPPHRGGGRSRTPTGASDAACDQALDFAQQRSVVPYVHSTCNRGIENGPPGQLWVEYAGSARRPQSSRSHRNVIWITRGPRVFRRCSRDGSKTRLATSHAERESSIVSCKFAAKIEL